jgi:glycosyltransferase involved in cell wall biosynthesis
MRLHLVGLPHTQTTSEYLSCAYTQKVVKFCRMMHARGHEVVLYAGEENEAPCSEHVQLVSEAERREWFGAGFNTVTTPLEWDEREPYWQAFNAAALREIPKRVGDPLELLLITTGWPMREVMRELPLEALEWAVGYEGIFARCCAFESHVWRHHVYGRQRWSWGRFYDDTIPNFFDPDEFYVADRKGDYLLFVGRLVERKGPHVAAMIAARLGMQLVVAGPGGVVRGGRMVVDGITLEGDVEYVGEVGVEERARLMAEARAVLVPTLYLEPFGGVAVEAMFAGTPAVTTDYGAFVETVEPGVTGYRFRTLREAIVATVQAMQLEPDVIRQRAIERYSLNVVGAQFERWFEQVHGLWGVGWAA